VPSPLEKNQIISGLKMDTFPKFIIETDSQEGD
jgi:hypothetical protein